MIRDQPCVVPAEIFSGGRGNSGLLIESIPWTPILQPHWPPDFGLSGASALVPVEPRPAVPRRELESQRHLQGVSC